MFMNNKKTSILLLLASTSLLFIGKFDFLGPVKISDYLIILSFLFFVIAFLKKEITIPWKDSIFKYILISLIFIIMGTITSLIFIERIEIIPVLKGYYHIIINLIYVIEIFILSKYDDNLIKKICYGFLLSLSVIFLIYLPYTNKYLLYMGSRFQGLLNDPNYFANFQIIPTIILLHLIKKDGLKIIIKIILSILFFFSIGLILWSGSRSGLMGIIFSLFFFIILILKNTPKLKVVAISLLIILSFPVGYILMPKQSHKNIETRINNVTQTKNLTTEQMGLINKISGKQDRLNIWVNSIYFITKNPLGYGPGYSKIINIQGENSTNRVSHNTIFEILLIGGIGLFITLLTLGYFFIKKTTKNRDSFTIFIVTCLIGIVTSSMFLDLFLYSKWFWVLVIIFYLKTSKFNLSINFK